jgi:hypothetical protein
MPDGVHILYRTSDLYFAAYLSSIDVPLLASEAGTGEDGRKRVVWVFSVPTDSDLRRIKAAYFGGTATVKARRFVDSLRSLKQMCYV